jgi:hypothetical protein
MTMFNDRFPNDLPDIIARIAAYAEAGIDPAFDSDMQELDRQFAELRFVGND